MFIPKLVELKHPIREARTRIEKEKESGWMNEAEEALRRIKMKLSKLKTLAILKEGEDLMICLWQLNEIISSLLLATEICTYDISYVQRKEAEGPVVKKFFGHGEQLEETPNANKGGIFNLSKGFQANSTPTTRAWRLYFGRETIKEGSGIGIILISPNEKMYSYAIRLKFKASNHAIDCRRKPYTGNRTRKKLQRGNYGCNGPIPQVLNHTSPKNLKPKSKSVDRAGNYKAGIPQPGSIGRYQKRSSVERTSSRKKGKATSKALRAKPNCNHKASGSN
nr:hypothetical protein [Tanacetum cinerariifolium]